MIQASGLTESTFFANIFSRGLLVVATLTATVLWGIPAFGVVISDDFSDGTDGGTGSPPNVTGPTWSHLDKLVGSTGQTWDASTGQYNLKAPSNGVIPLAPQFNDLGFVGSYVPTSFTDVKVSADFVDFPAFTNTLYFYGVGARLDGTNTVPTAGQGFTLRGYGYGYEPDNQEMVLWDFTGSGNNDIGAEFVLLDPENHDYRFELEVVGAVLTGRVIQLDTMEVVAEKSRDLIANPHFEDHDGDGDEGDNPPGTPKIQHVPYTSGYSGVFGVSTIFDDQVNITIDNFRTESIGGVPGDYNANGDVDAADYVMWRNGDSPDDTVAGYDLWKANFGKTAGSGSGSGVGEVPEPSTALLILLGIVGSWSSRRCRSGR